MASNGYGRPAGPPHARVLLLLGGRCLLYRTTRPYARLEAAREGLLRRYRVPGALRIKSPIGAGSGTLIARPIACNRRGYSAKVRRFGSSRRQATSSSHRESHTAGEALVGCRSELNGRPVPTLFGSPSVRPANRQEAKRIAEAVSRSSSAAFG
jgi:hypothetical protein